jgi:hypothetical protein
MIARPAATRTRGLATRGTRERKTRHQKAQGPGWITRLEQALKAAAVLPAVALAVLQQAREQ